MTIMRSSYEPTSATVGHAATAAPIRPWPKPWATCATSVAMMPSPGSHRANAGTDVLRRAESSITVVGRHRSDRRHAQYGRRG
jgi:hypothetical protein